MGLPCRHIFAIRSDQKLDLYSSDLCAQCWTLEYYHCNHRVLADSNFDFSDNSLDLSVTNRRTKPILSQQEKYRKTFHVTQKMASVVSESPMREFDEKLALLEQLLHMCEQGEEVVLPGVNLTISGSEGIDFFVC